LVHTLGREKLKTTKELLDITTQHASGEEVVGATFTLGNVGMAAHGGRATPTKTTIKGARKGAKGRKKGQNADRVASLQWPATTNSGRKPATLAKSSWRSLKRLVKHNLSDYTMMKNIMTSGISSSGDESRRDSGGKTVAPHPEEMEVVTIAGWSYSETSDATWLVETQALYASW
jgi:hypothetical protein